MSHLGHRTFMTIGLKLRRQFFRFLKQECIFLYLQGIKRGEVGDWFVQVNYGIPDSPVLLVEGPGGKRRTIKYIQQVPLSFSLLVILVQELFKTVFFLYRTLSLKGRDKQNI